MFYSNLILIKKGPLSQVWLAAHWQQRLTKSLIRDCDIDVSVERIRSPDTPHALRLSGQLLLGLVRIYQKKVGYLQEDAADALTKINVNLRPKKSKKDLPEVGPNLNIDLDLNREDFIQGIDYLDELDDIIPGEFPPYQEEDDLIVISPKSPKQPQGLDLTLTQGGEDDLMDVSKELEQEEPEEEPEQGRNHDGPQDDIDVGIELDALDLFDEPDEKRKSDVSLVSGVSGVSGGSMSLGELETPAKDSTMSSLQKSTTSVTALELQKQVEDDGLGIPAPPAVQARKRQRKAQPVKRDRQTELKSKQIQKQIDDTTDIVMPERGMLPLRKRQKLQYEAVKDVKSTIKDPETGMESLGYGYCTEEPPLAQELRDFLQLGYGLKMVKFPLREDLPEEKKQVGGGAAEEEEEDEVEVGRREEEQHEDEMEVPFELDDMEPADQEQDLSRMSGGFQSLGTLETDGSRLSTIPMKLKDDATKLKDAHDFFGENGKSEEEAGEESMMSKRASERTKKTLQGIKNEMKKQKSSEMNFQEWVADRSQTTAALAFYQLLVLKSHQYIGVSQDGPFEDIIVSKGPKFSRTVSSVSQ